MDSTIQPVGLCTFAAVNYYCRESASSRYELAPRPLQRLREDFRAGRSLWSTTNHSDVVLRGLNYKGFVRP
jgi:hypothetical protein